MFYKDLSPVVLNLGEVLTERKKADLQVHSP